MTTSLTEGHFLFMPNSKATREKSGNRRQKTSAKSNYYHFYLETIEERINATAKNSYTEMSENICDHLILKLREFEERIYRLFPVIPTVAIVSGINKADHEYMYEELNKSLVNKISVTTLVLNSRNCTNLKTSWKYIFTTLYNILELDTSGVDVSNLTAKALKDILAAKEGVRNTPLTLILIFEDFQVMSEEVVNHIILCVHQYVDDFPVVIIVNIAVLMSALYEKLTWNAASHLNVKEFPVSSSFELIGEIMKDLITNPKIPFMISPNLLSWLYEHFSMYNLSVNQFNHNLKVALYYHMKTRGFLEEAFYENIDLDSAFFSKTWLIQNMAQLQNKEAGKSIGKRKGDLKVREVTFQVEQLFDWYTLSIGLTYALYEMLQVMRKEVQMFAKDFHAIYILLLNGDLLADETFHGTLKYLNSTSDTKILIDCVVACQKELTKTLGQLSTEQEKISLGEIVDGLECMKSKLESNKESLSSSLRSQVVKALTSLITDHFITRNPLKIHSLAGLAFCELPADMSMLVDPSLLNSIHKDLSKPSSVIGEDLSVARRPPVCTVYRLLNESGKIVNLYDWFQSYNFYNEEGVDDIDMVQAKFFSAVAELEFLGIIKPHKKKVDHVHKLTHGLLY